MANVNANININVNTGESILQLQALQNKINSLNKTMAAMGPKSQQQMLRFNQTLIEGANASKMFNASIVPVTRSVDQFTTKLEKNKFTLGEYTRYATSQLPGMSRVFRREFDTMERVATDRVRKIATQYVALGEAGAKAQKAIALTPTGGLNLKDSNTQAAIAAQRHAILNKVLTDGSTKMLNWGKNTQWAGRQLMVGFSIPLAMLGTTAARTFAELDKASIAFKRVYGDLDTTTAEMERNLDATKALGKEYTKYGIAVKDTVDLGARAAATGARNEDLTAATEQTLRLATLGQMDYNTALDATISLQTAFRVSNDELGRSIDFLNAVENQTVLTLQDMAVAIPRVAPVIKGLGGDVQDLAIFMTAMREGGVSAENGANALKSGLASLINPTERAKETLAKFKINLDGIVQTNKGDLMGIVTEFGRALSALDEFSQQQALEQIFGKYQYARMGALFKNIIDDSGQAARAMDLAGQSAEDLAKLADRELSNISEATSTKFTAAIEQLKLAIAPVGEQFMKVATPIIEFASRMINAFNEMPEGIKNFVTIATVGLAGLGPIILMTIGLLANGLANITKGLLVIRRGFQRLTGSGKSVEYLATAELEAAAATAQLETRIGGLTSSMLLQQSAVKTLAGLYGDLAGAASRAVGLMPSTVPMVGAAGRAAAKGSSQLKMAAGGVVPGTGNKDTIPALLTPGESVVTKKATQKYGPIISAMNNGTLPGFSLGVKAVQSMRSLFNRTSPSLSYPSSPRRAPRPFQTIRSSFAKDVPEDVIRQAYILGGGKGQLDDDIVKRYSRTATAHTGKAKRYDEKGQLSKKGRKGWTLEGTRLTSTGENESLQNVFSSSSSKKQAYAIAVKNGLLEDKFTKKIIGQIIYGGYHPTTKAEYGVLESLLQTLSKDKTFTKSLSSGVQDQFAILFGTTKIRNGNVGSLDISKLGEDKYGIWSGEARTLQQLVEDVLYPKLPIVRANNGFVPGVGNTDKIPALLTPGESVVTKKATQKYGPIINAMNAGTLPGYEDGLPAARGHFTRSKKIDDPAEIRRMAEAGIAAAGERGSEEYQKIIKALDENQKVQAKLYTNAIVDIPELANKESMTGTEFGRMLAGSAGRTKMMDPFVDEMAKELGVSASTLRSNPKFVQSIDNIAAEVGETLARRGGDFVDDRAFNDAFNKAIDQKIASGAFSAEESAALQNVRTRKTRAQFYIEGQKVGGRKPIPGAGVKAYPAGGLSPWSTEFLTEEGNEARRRAEERRAEKRQAYRARQTNETTMQRTTNLVDQTIAQRARALMKKDPTISRQEALRQVRVTEAASRKQRLFAEAREIKRRTGVGSEKALEFARKNEQQRERQRLIRVQNAKDVVAKKAIEEEQVRQTARDAAAKQQNKKSIQNIFETQRQTQQIQSQLNQTQAKAATLLRGGTTVGGQKTPSRMRTGISRVGQGVGRVAGRVSGGLGLASMIPFMAQDEEGKFLGMDANMLGMGLVGASMVQPLMKGAIKAAVAHPAITAVIAGVAGLTAGFIALKRGLDNNIEAGKKYANSLTMSTEDQEKIADIFGTQTYAQRRRTQEIQKLTGLTTAEQQMGAEFVQTEPGKAMAEEAKIALEKNAQGFASNLATQIARLIISGAVTAKQGKAIVAGLTKELGKPEMAIPIITRVESIIGPNGKDITKEPLKVVANLVLETEKTFDDLELSAERIGSYASDSWSDNVLGLGALYSGEIDAAIEADAAQANAFIESSKQILTAIDDQISRQQILIDKLKEKKRLADSETKKEGFQEDIDIAGKNIDRLNKEREKKEKEYRDRVINLYSSGPNIAQKFTTGFMDLEEKTGLIDLEGAVNRFIQSANTISKQVTPNQLPEGIRRSLVKGGFLTSDGAVVGGKEEEFQKIAQTMLGPAAMQQLFPETMDADKLKASLLVDIKFGKIDPQMLTALDVLSEKTRTLALEFYTKGNLEEFNAIANVGTMGDDVSKSFEEIQNNAEYTKEQIVGLAGALGDLGDEADRVALLDAFKSSPKGIEQFIASMKTLKDLNVDVAELFSLQGIEGVNDLAKNLTPTLDKLEESFNSKKFKDAAKAIQELSPKDTKGRIKKTFDVVTEINIQENGQPLTESSYNAHINQIIESSGMNRAEVMQLPTNQIMKAIAINIAVQPMVSELKGRIREILTRSMAIPDPAAAAAVAETAQPLLQAVEMLESLGGGSLTAPAPEVNRRPNPEPEPKPSGGSGSKEKKTNYVKDMLKGFLDQVKMFADAEATLDTLQKAKNGLINKIANQGKSNEGLVNQLRQMNLSENIIADLISKGPDALKQAVKRFGNKKTGAEAIAKANRAEFRGTMSGLLGQAGERVGAATRNLAATRTLAQRGATPDLIQRAMQDQEFANIMAQKNGSKRQKLIDQYLASLKQELQLEKDIARAQDPIQAQIEDLTTAHEKNTKEIDNQIEKAQEKVDLIQEEIDYLDELNEKDQQRIRGLEREKEMIQRQIEVLERANEMDQRKIDSLRREDELRNRVSDALDHELSLMSQQEEKIRDTYNERIKALDTVAKINDHIIAQQKNQINLAGALTSGDIAAAAQAQQEMQAADAQYAQDQMRSGLEASMDRSIAALRTSGGLSREEAEDKINAIKEQSYQTSLLIRDIEDAIYQRNQQMVPLKDSIYSKDLAIRDISDQIYNRESIILDITNQRLKPAQAQVAILEKEKNIQDKIFNDKIEQLQLDADMAQMTDAQKTRVNQLAGEWYKVAQQIKNARDIAASAEAKLGTPPTPAPGESDKDYQKRLSAWKDRLRSIKQDEQTAIDAAYSSGLGYLNSVKFATGGVVGSGSRDSVPAMLTPGEYVVRKSSVNKYGKAMFDKINMGAFEMPKYNVPSPSSAMVSTGSAKTNISAPTYNTYSVNVTVPDTNASPDVIANKVLMRIAETDRMNIRSIRGNR